MLALSLFIKYALEILSSLPFAPVPPSMPWKSIVPSASIDILTFDVTPSAAFANLKLLEAGSYPILASDVAPLRLIQQSLSSSVSKVNFTSPVLLICKLLFGLTCPIPTSPALVTVNNPLALFKSQSVPIPKFSLPSRPKNILP